MSQLPKISHHRLNPVHQLTAQDQYQQTRAVACAGESALTLFVNQRELVTLMTLGMYPEELALGYIYNQRLVESIEDVESVTVDWERERADINLRTELTDWDEKLSTKIITSGCGQGTIYSCTLDKLYDQRLPNLSIEQSSIYNLLKKMAQHNQVYTSAGAVHGCALCTQNEVLIAVEDIGRHNASDAIAGMMWLQNISGADKIFYTTGRITSEIVMKSAHMGIPILLSRSGVTQMGLDIAQDLNMTLIARAKGKAFLVYTNPNSIVYDAIPPKPAST
ncbi:MAG: formate dehydrogenase accessory sulfurtransferase FdhD [Candidatus Oxydemutatoraceae bacterium WSBS_2016_MAG_OTU14]